MARSLNRVMLIGNLTRDPELRYTSKGTAVCNFGLATNRYWTPAESEETQEKTEFHRIVAWQKLAELCAQLLFKGRKVYVDGRLQTRSWTDKDGLERRTTEVVINNMIILDSRKKGEADGGEAEKEPAKEEESPAEGQKKTQAAPASKKKKKEEVKKDQPVEKKPAEKEEVKADDIPF